MFNKLERFRNLKNTNGDEWYLPNDPQYNNLYQAPGNQIANTQFLSSERQKKEQIFLDHEAHIQ